MPSVRFATYKTADGTITRTGHCPDYMMPLQVLDGEAVLPADEGVTNTTHKVVDGAIVPV